MRLFTAIDLPRELRRKINKLGLLPFEGKRVEEENYHINLNFIGDVNDEKEIIAKLEKAEFKPFTVEVNGFGAFPSQNFVRVLFLNCHSAKLAELHDKIVNSLGVERRKYNPHITLMRVKRVQKEELPAFFQKQFNESFEVNDFVLYESELTPQGPIYKIVKRFSSTSG